MRLSKSIIVFAFAMAGAAYGAPASQETGSHAVYANYTAIWLAKDGDIDSSNYSIGVDGSNSIPGSDVLMHVKFCSPKSPFICAHGDFYNFAVPRHRLKADEKWRFAGRTYEVVPGYLPHGMFQQPVHSKDIDRTFEMLNSKIIVNVIRTVVKIKGKTCIQTFMYSRARGILGDLGRCDEPNKHDSWSYWLTGTDGVGSPSFERAISPKAIMTQQETAILYKERCR